MNKKIILNVIIISLIYQVLFSLTDNPYLIACFTLSTILKQYQYDMFSILNIHIALSCYILRIYFIKTIPPKNENWINPFG